VFTIFHVLHLVFVLLGLITGFHFGHRYGLVGGFAGALIGGYLGFVAGKLPFSLSSWFVFHQLRRKSAAELWSDLQDDTYLMPNMVLRELRRRGEPMSTGLNLVLAMLESEDRLQRLRGYAAFLSNFPEMSERLLNYSPDSTGTERRGAVNNLRSSLISTNPDS